MSKEAVDFPLQLPWVCASCGTNNAARLSLDDLEEMDPEEIEAFQDANEQQCRKCGDTPEVP